MKNFIKPTIVFPTFPAIFIWIKADYEKVNTYGQYVDFIHKCLTYGDTSVNPVRKDVYQKLASALFAVETNISFESKGIEILANSK